MAILRSIIQTAMFCQLNKLNLIDILYTYSYYFIKYILIFQKIFYVKYIAIGLIASCISHDCHIGFKMYSIIIYR